MCSCVQGNVMHNVESNSKEMTPVNRVTTWVQEADAVQEWLGCEILKQGGLVTVGLPYNRNGATTDRETINFGAAKWLIERNHYNPRIIKQVNQMNASRFNATPTDFKALHFQMECTRGGRPNPLHSIAPGWTSLHHNGMGLIAQPKHMCQALAEAIDHMPQYAGLDIKIIDGDHSELVTLEQLMERDDIIMLPPPSRALAIPMPMLLIRHPCAPKSLL
jgi:hypothetical protein